MLNDQRKKGHPIRNTILVILGLAFVVGALNRNNSSSEASPSKKSDVETPAAIDDWKAVTDITQESVIQLLGAKRQSNYPSGGEHIGSARKERREEFDFLLCGEQAGNGCWGSSRSGGCYFNRRPDVYLNALFRLHSSVSPDKSLEIWSGLRSSNERSIKSCPSPALSRSFDIEGPTRRSFLSILIMVSQA